MQLSHSFSQFYSQNRFDTVVDTLQVQKFLFANHKIKHWEETLEHKYKLTVSAYFCIWIHDSRSQKKNMISYIQSYNKKLKSKNSRESKTSGLQKKTYNA